MSCCGWATHTRVAQICSLRISKSTPAGPGRDALQQSRSPRDPTRAPAARLRVLARYYAPEPAPHPSRRSRAATARAMADRMLSHISRSGLQFVHLQPSRSTSIDICMVGRNFHLSTCESTCSNITAAATPRCLPERQNTTADNIGPPLQLKNTLVKVRCASRIQVRKFSWVTILSMIS